MGGCASLDAEDPMYDAWEGEGSLEGARCAVLRAVSWVHERACMRHSGERTNSYIFEGYEYTTMKYANEKRQQDVGTSLSQPQTLLVCLKNNNVFN